MTDRVLLCDDDPIFFFEIISVCKDIRDGVEGLLDVAPPAAILIDPFLEFLAMVWLFWLILFQWNVPSLAPALPSDQRTSA